MNKPFNKKMGYFTYFTEKTKPERDRANAMKDNDGGEDTAEKK